MAAPRYRATMTTPTRGAQSAFTLIELMIGIGILGLLLAIAVPSFNSVMRTNKVAAQVNSVVSALVTARAEATKRGIPVSVCAADNTGLACSSTTESNWANGWVIFTDRVSTQGSVDTGDEVITHSGAIGDGMSLVTNSVGFVRFGRDGSPTNGTTFALNLKHSACQGKEKRSITVDVTGRVSLAKVDC
jgi:type IV fimbrial biogenesis protein FimT